MAVAEAERRLACNFFLFLSFHPVPSCEISFLALRCVEGRERLFCITESQIIDRDRDSSAQLKGHSAGLCAIT